MISRATIRVNNLSLNYGNKQILNDLSFSAYQGEIIGVTGISGSGKSSLFHCLCGVVPNLIDGKMTGEIYINDDSIKKLSLAEISTRAGIVFQNPETQLFLPTIEDEVAFGAENLCLEQTELVERIETALQITGLTHLRMSSPFQLSGGQKQLVVLAAVLAMNPAILLLDEVFAQIDRRGRENILPTISELAVQGKTILMIDHNPDNLKICTRILHLENGVLEENAV